MWNWEKGHSSAPYRDSMGSSKLVFQKRIKFCRDHLYVNLIKKVNVTHVLFFMVLPWWWLKHQYYSNGIDAVQKYIISMETSDIWHINTLSHTNHKSQWDQCHIFTVLPWRWPNHIPFQWGVAWITTEHTQLHQTLKLLDLQPFTGNKRITAPPTDRN